MQTKGRKLWGALSSALPLCGGKLPSDARCSLHRRRVLLLRCFCQKIQFPIAVSFSVRLSRPLPSPTFLFCFFISLAIKNWQPHLSLSVLPPPPKGKVWKSLNKGIIASIKALKMRNSVRYYAELSVDFTVLGAEYWNIHQLSCMSHRISEAKAV